VLATVEHRAVPDLVATAATLPDTNPIVLRLPPVEPAGVGADVLSRPDATRLARGGLAEVRAADGRGPQDADAPRVSADPPGADGPAAVFRRAGEVWEVRFEELTVHLSPSKGMDDLAALLEHPGREIHCLELAGAAVEEPAMGEVIDAQARRHYEARIRDLHEEIDEADAAHDLARAERARSELDILVEHLTTAVGLGGRGRRHGGTTERARSAVTHRVRAAIRRIAAAHPALGEHLGATVATGTYCCYRPATPVRWLR
jgi:hypothetical protein